MNKNFLDKLFKIYSELNCSLAKKLNFNDFLVSTYFIDGSLLYIYQYVDFKLKYRYDNKIPNNLKINYNIKEIAEFIKLPNEIIDIVVFLHELFIKIKKNSELITEEDILKLNEYYKKFV